MAFGIANPAALLAHLEERMSQFEQRISKHLASVSETLETMRQEQLARETSQNISNLADQLQSISESALKYPGDVMIARIDRLNELAQRLDGDVVKGFEAVVARLETDLVALAERTDRLGASMEGNLTALSQRTDVIGASTTQFSDTLLQIAESITKLGAQDHSVLRSPIEQIQMLAQRLDADVVKGFENVVKRLESDLVTVGAGQQALQSAFAAMGNSVQQVTADLSGTKERMDEISRYLLSPARDAVDDRITLDFRALIDGDFPAVAKPVWRATKTTLDLLAKMNTAPLAQHSPGLKAFDWANYIHLSALRLAHAGMMLKRAGIEKGTVLDFGSYFGNFAFFARQLGFQVDAADSYGAYGGVFDETIDALGKAGVNVIDIAHSTRDYAKAFQKKYDAVFCMGVIEHVPHSPKGLLQSLMSVLRPGGCLLIDTPNLLYLYNRERLVRGQSVFAPIEDQFNADPPFEGHHREYTPDEVKWMLKSIGLHVDETELFNYSIYGLTELTGRDADYFRRMEASPANREYMMVRATTPAS